MSPRNWDAEPDDYFDPTVASSGEPQAEASETLDAIVDSQRVPLWSKVTEEFRQNGCWPRERVMIVAEKAFQLGKLAGQPLPPVEPEEK